MEQRDPELFAWIGEDEFGSGTVGLKQGAVRAGMIPLVSVNREKIDYAALVRQLQLQADQFGKTIRLVRYTAVETVITLTPRPQG
jgi:hypothetical protein